MIYYYYYNYHLLFKIISITSSLVLQDDRQLNHLIFIIIRNRILCFINKLTTMLLVLCKPVKLQSDFFSQYNPVSNYSSFIHFYRSNSLIGCLELLYWGYY